MSGSDDIALLVRLRFPGTNAPPPPGSGSGASHDWSRRQEQISAYRADLMRMQSTVVRELADKERERLRLEDRDRRDRVSPPATRPNFAYWARQEEWWLSNAALLLCDIEPRVGLGLTIAGRVNPSHEGYLADLPKYFRAEVEANNSLSDSARESLNLAREIVSNAFAARRKGKLTIDDDGKVSPREFLLWARTRTYELGALEELIQDVPSTHALQDRIKQLEEQLAKAWDQFDEDDEHYPWELDIAFQAWRSVTGQKRAAGTPTTQLRGWIKKNYPGLKPETIKRIAIVANWEKQPGRKRSQKK